MFRWQNKNQGLKHRPIVATLGEGIDGVLIHLLDGIHQLSIVRVHMNGLSHLRLIKTFAGEGGSTNLVHE